MNRIARAKIWLSFVLLMSLLMAITFTTALAIEMNVDATPLIGDTVWSDLDGDGKNEDHEPGIDGITVHLLNDDTNEIIATTTTANNGQYQFTNLALGKYRVKFDLPPNHVFTGQDQFGEHKDSDADPDTGQSHIIYITGANQSINNVDAGMLVPGTVTGIVWSDKNGDGLRYNESGVDVVFHEGFEADDISYDHWKAVAYANYNPVVTDTTFARLGNQSLHVHLSYDSWEEDANTPDPEKALRLHTEKLPNFRNFRHGQEYWYAFSIYLPDDYEINETRDVLTQFYAPHDRYLGEPSRNPPFSLATSGPYWSLILRGDPRDKIENKDYEVEKNWPLAEWEEDKGQWVDWVFQIRWSCEADWECNSAGERGEEPCACLEDVEGLTRIWKDGELLLDYHGLNTYNDSKGPYWKIGIYEPNWRSTVYTGTSHSVYFDEILVSSISVNLLDNSGKILQTTPLDATGTYSFSDVPAKQSLQVEFVLPDGYMLTAPDQGTNDNKDSDAALHNGRTPTFSLTKSAETVTHMDAGILLPGSVGDRVWLDDNRNGRQDWNESGMAGVTLHLVYKGNIIQTTTTNKKGNYLFDNLQPLEQYRIRIDIPDGYALTIKDAVGIPDKKDSDFFRGSGQTIKFQLTQSDQFDQRWDAGLIVEAP